MRRMNEKKRREKIKREAPKRFTVKIQ